MGKVKWDAPADQTLLAKILETHELSVDVAKVSEAWPVQEDEHRPTPRAIKERINRIKENIRLRNASSATPGTSNPVTPKKRTPRKKADDPSTPASSSRKRKRPNKDTTADEDQVKGNEQENVSTEENESHVEPIIKEEIDMSFLDPLLHLQEKEESFYADNENSDGEWTEAKHEPESDSDELLLK
ncbi:unnamed protein product [Penicillium glandicola]